MYLLCIIKIDIKRQRFISDYKYRKLKNIIIMRKTEIIIPYGAQTKLVKDTGLTAVSVRAALKGITNSKNADLVRRRALRFYGGVEIKNKPL